MKSLKQQGCLLIISTMLVCRVLVAMCDLPLIEEADSSGSAASDGETSTAVSSQQTLSRSPLTIKEGAELRLLLRVMTAWTTYCRHWRARRASGDLDQEPEFLSA